MATETSKVHAFMCAFVDGLALRDGLAGVQIASAPLGGDSARAESIQLGGVTMSQEWGMLGNRRREETFTVRGIAWAFRAGKNEGTFREVRARLFELLGEIEDFLRVDPTVGNVVKVCQLKNGELEPGSNEDGIWAQFDFDIEATTSLSSS